MLFWITSVNVKTALDNFYATFENIWATFFNHASGHTVHNLFQHFLMKIKSEINKILDLLNRRIPADLNAYLNSWITSTETYNNSLTQEQKYLFKFFVL